MISKYFNIEIKDEESERFILDVLSHVANTNLDIFEDIVADFNTYNERVGFAIDFLLKNKCIDTHSGCYYIIKDKGALIYEQYKIVQNGKIETKEALNLYAFVFDTGRTLDSFNTFADLLVCYDAYIQTRK